MTFENECRYKIKHEETLENYWLIYSQKLIQAEKRIKSYERKILSYEEEVLVELDNFFKLKRNLFSSYISNGFNEIITLLPSYCSNIQFIHEIFLKCDYRIQKSERLRQNDFNMNFNNNNNNNNSFDLMNTFKNDSKINNQDYDSVLSLDCTDYIQVKNDEMNYIYSIQSAFYRLNLQEKLSLIKK